jgi:hypothetical protein
VMRGRPGRGDKNRANLVAIEADVRLAVRRRGRRTCTAGETGIRQSGEHSAAGKGATWPRCERLLGREHVGHHIGYRRVTATSSRRPHGSSVGDFRTSACVDRPRVAPASTSATSMSRGSCGHRFRTQAPRQGAQPKHEVQLTERQNTVPWDDVVARSRTLLVPCR